MQTILFSLDMLKVMCTYFTVDIDLKGDTMNVNVRDHLYM